MATNKTFMAHELPEKEMKMLYSLLGKKFPKEKITQSKFRYKFRLSKRIVEDEKG